MAALAIRMQLALLSFPVLSGALMEITQYSATRMCQQENLPTSFCRIPRGGIMIGLPSAVGSSIFSLQAQHCAGSVTYHDIVRRDYKQQRSLSLICCL
jgi:hypothetical protein